MPPPWPPHPTRQPLRHSGGREAEAAAAAAHGALFRCPSSQIPSPRSAPHLAETQPQAQDWTPSRPRGVRPAQREKQGEVPPHPPAPDWGPARPPRGPGKEKRDGAQPGPALVTSRAVDPAEPEGSREERLKRGAVGLRSGSGGYWGGSGNREGARPEESLPIPPNPPPCGEREGESMRLGGKSPSRLFLAASDGKDQIID
ncbi:uncharacterized protein [Notamacropus eugenii]|uniref:uncharacterized protein n=1 Tax=Notamacropus eugenii TaxID=9315 RepID=UPI003B67B7CB